MSDQTVFVALYVHKHGTDTHVFSTYDGAMQLREEIAKEWWSYQFPDEDVPDNAGEEYFARMGEYWAGEWFSVVEAFVNP